MQLRRSLLALFVLASPAFAADDAPPPPKTGTYTTAFSEQSPLTSKQELSKRFPKQDLPYDLSQEPFLIHVPDDYTPATPHGILLLINYKDNDTLPPLWPPVLAKHHLIYAMDTRHEHPEAVTAAISVDAVHNLQKTYNIDPARIYVVGVQGTQHAALFYADVFTASLTWAHIEYYRPLTEPKTRGIYPPKLPRPQGPSVALSKTHPHILGIRPDTDPAVIAYQNLILKALRQDGYSHVQTLDITMEDFHYPNLTTPWLESALAFFESNSPAPQPQPTPAAPSPLAPKATASTKPTLSEPQRLLALANYCIKNKAYPAARQRLETILKDYPDDPAAKDARALLDSITKPVAPSSTWKTTIEDHRHHE